MRMQSFYAERFEREMGCTEAEWLRWLPVAIGVHFAGLDEAQRYAFMKRFDLYMQRGGG